MAPTSPAAGRWETLWHYMRGGPGAFHGDTIYSRGGGRRQPHCCEAYMQKSPRYRRAENYCICDGLTYRITYGQKKRT